MKARPIARPGLDRAVARLRRQGRSHAVDARGAGHAPDIGQAEEQDRARERAEQEVLDRALGRVGVVAGEAGQHVAGQDHQLQGDEEEQQIVEPATSIAAGDGEDEDRRELGDGQAARLQVVAREQDRQGRDRHEQHVEEDGQVVQRVRPPNAGRCGRPGSGSPRPTMPARRATWRGSGAPAGHGHVHDQDRRRHQDGDDDRGRSFRGRTSSSSSPLSRRPPRPPPGTPGRGAEEIEQQAREEPEHDDQDGQRERG
jgi:hypothetical protein